ncbi:MAG: uracil-DNA glycosylase family protein [Candidatus Dojkabacteria bacterium]|nr:uracil-DNA glycosylase family protein [Candidatus Dojkabacteria bacterium]
MTKQEKLSIVFDEIFHLNVCGEDKEKVRRDISKTNIDSEIMIIAEAMAPEQVRLSGVNYFYKDGRIGNTGKSLEKFLNKFNYTVCTDKPNCIYHTEIVHNFPGYEIKNGKKSIKRPSKEEIRVSIKSNILKKEIAIIKPKLILLMGDTAYKSFYKYFLDIQSYNNLTKEIDYISKTKKFKRHQNIPVIPIQHSSGANPRFQEMFKNTELIDFINEILNNPMDLKLLKVAIKNSWCKDTVCPSVTEMWNRSNKTIGQCAVTALLVYKYLGGKIYKGDILEKGYSHYWNVLPNGKKVDLTKSQFGYEMVILNNIKEKKPEEMLKDEELLNRYKILERQVGFQLKNLKKVI